MSKYSALADHLANQQGRSVTLTFDQIERILGAALPHSALLYDRWWGDSNTDDGHSWSHEWMDAGWTVDQLHRDERWVVFRRR